MKEGLTLEYNYMDKTLKMNLVKSFEDMLQRFLGLLPALYKLIEIDTLTIFHFHPFLPSPYIWL